MSNFLSKNCIWCNCYINVSKDHIKLLGDYINDYANILINHTRRNVRVFFFFLRYRRKSEANKWETFGTLGGSRLTR